MSSNDQYRHIPPHMRDAITHNLQQTLPPHLKKFQEAGGPLPVHVEQAIAQHMERSLPQHLKQYSQPYLSQHIHNQPLPMPTQTETPKPINPDFVPQAGFNAAPLNFNQSPQSPQSPAPPRQNLAYASTTNQPAGAGGEYDFIFNPTSKQHSTSAVLGGASILGRSLIFGGLLLILLIAGVLIKNLFFTTDFSPYVAVTQEQAAIIHLSATASEQTAISAANENFAATASMSLKSSQQQILTYLGERGTKVNETVLKAKTSSRLDTDLTTASQAGTFDTTFHDIMKSKLSSYRASLDTAYAKTKGKKGHALLEDAYKQSDLLLLQLEADKN